MPSPQRAQVVWEHDVDKALSDMNRQLTAIQEQNEALKETGGHAEDASKKTDLLGGSLDGVVSKVAGIVSIGAAMAGIVDSVRDFQSLQANAAAGLLGEEATRKQLIQISGGDAERFAELSAISDDVSTRFGIERSAAQQFTFEGASLGLTDAEILRSARFSRFTADPTSLITGAAGFQAAFGEETTGGSIDSIVNAGLQAAGVSKVGVSDIFREALGGAQAVKSIGGTGEELLAAIGVATVALKSTEEATTQVRALANLLATEGGAFKDAGLLGGLEILEAMSPDDLQDLVGKNVRAKGGASVLLQNLDQFRATLAAEERAIEATGSADSNINRAVALAESLPSVAGIERAKSGAAMQITAERDAFQDELTREAIRSAYQATLAEAEIGPVNRGILGAQLGTLGLINTLFGLDTPDRMTQQRIMSLQILKDPNATDLFLENLRGIGAEFDTVYDDTGRFRHIENLKFGLPAAVPAVDLEAATQ